MNRPSSITRRLLQSGVAAGPLFVATFLTAGAARPGYDPLRHPVSSLALGPGGWVQTANFAVAGALYVSFAAGLLRDHDDLPRSKPGTVLIGATGLGLLGAAVFVTDPVSGYPPGTPDALDGYSSVVAAMHDVSAVPVFLGLPAAALAYAWAFARRGRRAWAVCSAGAGVVMLASFGLASAGFSQHPDLVEVGGLWQRISIITGLGWLTALGVQALARPAPSGAIS